MKISLHAFSRLIERVPQASLWHSDIKVRRIRDIICESNFIGQKDFADQYEGDLKVSITRTMRVVVVVKDDVVLTIYPIES